MVSGLLYCLPLLQSGSNIRNKKNKHRTFSSPAGGEVPVPPHSDSDRRCPYHSYAFETSHLTYSFATRRCQKFGGKRTPTSKTPIIPVPLTESPNFNS